MKIVLVNHTFQIPRFYKRWQMLAAQHPDLDVTLITLKSYEWDIKGSMIFGSDMIIEGKDIEEGNFRIISVSCETHKYRSWTSKEMVEVIKKIKPDIVYHIGTHKQDSALQCIHAVRKYLGPKSKAIIFSMRGPAMNISYPVRRKTESVFYWWLRIFNYWQLKKKLRYLNNNADAVICHYPDAVRCFREEGFTKQIYMSTQVGVDPDIYHPDEAARKKVREKYNLGDAFVFGTACRFIPDKGLQEIIKALPSDGNWKCLLMGKGSEDYTNALKRLIHDRGLDGKIILTGYVDWKEIADYWNAIDCAVHVPRTTDIWQETFSLAVIQAMASGKPVIGNDSGSVPYQMGPNGILVHEGDIQDLHDKMEWVIAYPDKAKNIGDKMYDYAVNSFSIQHLNDQFYDIINDVYNGTYDKNLIDMVTYHPVLN